MSKFIRVADKAAMLATLARLQAEGFSFDAIATNDATKTAKRPQVIAFKEGETVNVLFNEMAEGVSFYGRRAAVEARDLALSIIAEIKPAAAVDTVTNRIARVKAEMRELAAYEAAIPATGDQGVDLVAALLQVEALQEEAATLDTIDSVWLAIMETFKKMNIAFDDVERLKVESEKSGSRLNILFRMTRLYRRSEKAAAGFGYIGVGCISFAQGRLAVFKRRAVRLVARRLAAG